MVQVLMGIDYSELKWKRESRDLLRAFELETSVSSKRTSRKMSKVSLLPIWMVISLPTIIIWIVRAELKLLVLSRCAAGVSKTLALLENAKDESRTIQKTFPLFGSDHERKPPYGLDIANMLAMYQASTADLFSPPYWVGAESRLTTWIAWEILYLDSGCLQNKRGGR